MKIRLAAPVIALAMWTGLAHADAVSDALNAAQEAYAKGELGQTAAQVTTAARAVQALQQERLARALPQPTEGWTMTQGENGAGAMGLFGGAVGTIADATYSHDDGRSFTLTLTADSPVVASMAGILGNPQMMAMMGKVVKVGATEMLDQDGSLSALVANRVLVQAQGSSVEDMATILSAMDFDVLARFDQ
ncbi:hypothetical protein [Gemmobacter denitrificans]|uniref:Uncharacterized protein n=1 Tax=Gemmobacter denitrificans TaxID=3123040 RepID=A0ABU8C0Q6_9RHOB